MNEERAHSVESRSESLPAPLGQAPVFEERGNRTAETEPAAWPDMPESDLGAPPVAVVGAEAGTAEAADPAKPAGAEQARIEVLVQSLRKQETCLQEQAALAKTQEERLRALETSVAGRLDEANDFLMKLIAETETRFAQELEQIQARLEQTGEPERETQSRQDALAQAWQSAPLLLRLKFARELLHGEHPYQAVLKEAAEMEELRRRGRDFESWITGYPSLFADAVTRFYSDGEGGSSAAETLAAATLREARQTLELCLAALGVEWIAPEPGAALTEEVEVVGVEEGPHPAGRVGHLRRRGFRWQGRLCLPAQVTRTAPYEAAPVPEVQETPAAPTIITPPERALEAEQAQREAPPATAAGAGAERWPAWYRTLRQRGLNCAVPAVQRLLDLLDALVEAGLNPDAPPDTETMRTLLAPLLPLLGSRNLAGPLLLPPEWEAVFLEGRDTMLSWLRATLAVEVVIPAGGEPFDPARMEAVGVRRTAHAHEFDTVARVEQVGIQWRGDALFRAQVMRYDQGGGV